MNVIEWLEVSSTVNIIHNILEDGLTAALIVLVMSVAKACLITAKVLKFRAFMQYTRELSLHEIEILNKTFFRS